MKTPILSGLTGLTRVVCLCAILALAMLLLPGPAHALAAPAQTAPPVVDDPCFFSQHARKLRRFDLDNARW